MNTELRAIDSSIYHKIYNDTTIQNANTIINSIAKLKPLNTGKYVLGFDQATRRTGITIGNDKGEPILIGLLERDDNIEPNSIAYKVKFKETFKVLFDNLDITHVLYEDTFSKGFTEVDDTLSAMKPIFEEMKLEYDYKYEAICLRQQTWKSVFCGSNQKEAVEDKIHTIYPYLSTYEDTYDSMGIFFFYRLEILPTLNQAVTKIRKGMKVCKIHKLQLSVIQLNNKKEIVLTKEEANRAKTHGVGFFEYKPDMWVDDCCRCLTSTSNKLWVAEFHNLDKYKFIDAIWWRFNIVPDETKRLYIICYRTTVKKF